MAFEELVASGLDLDPHDHREPDSAQGADDWTRLAELLLRPPDMDVRQWVAHAGLDPRPFQSGSSVNKPMRISKAGNVYIRRALFMPALVAIQHDQAVRASYFRLLQRGKPKMKANIAVMRKRLHAIYGIFKTNTPFDPTKCFADPKAAENT